MVINIISGFSKVDDTILCTLANTHISFTPALLSFMPAHDMVALIYGPNSAIRPTRRGFTEAAAQQSLGCVLGVSWHRSVHKRQAAQPKVLLCQVHNNGPCLGGIR